MDLKNGVFKGRPVYWIAIGLLLAAVVLSLAGAVTIGSVDLEMGDVYRVILYKLFGIGDAEKYGTGSMSDIVWFIRLPRLVLAIGVGIALSISGTVMQAIVKILWLILTCWGFLPGQAWEQLWQLSCMWVWDLEKAIRESWHFWAPSEHRWLWLPWPMWEGEPLQ